MGQYVKELVEADFPQEVLENATPSVVDFWGDRCAPCSILAPILEELAAEFNGQVNFFKMKASDSIDVCSEYGVTAMPTLLLFKDGKIVNRFVGAVPKAQLLKFLQPALV